MGTVGSEGSQTLAGREPVLMPPRPGEVYRLQDDGRPVVIVSREELNRGDYVVAVSATTARLGERRERPNCVAFEAGQFGFSKDCVVPGESITCLEILELDLQSGPVGCLTDEAMRDVIRAVGNVIEAQCEPD